MRLIDAEALLESLANMCCADNNVKTRQIVDSTLHNLMPQIINDEPTIEAQPVKQAYWYCDGSDRVCDCCNYRLTEDEWFNGCDWNYCPQCGTKMDGGE